MFKLFQAGEQARQQASRCDQVAGRANRPSGLAGARASRHKLQPGEQEGQQSTGRADSQAAERADDQARALATALLERTTPMRMLAYGIPTNLLGECLRIAESSTIECFIWRGEQKRGRGASLPSKARNKYFIWHDVYSNFIKNQNIMQQISLFPNGGHFQCPLVNFAPPKKNSEQLHEIK